MKNKMKEPKFKVGDVVMFPKSTGESSGEAGLGGTVEEVDWGKTTKCAFNHYIYRVQWFKWDIDWLFYSGCHLKFCKGLKNSDMCVKCEYRFECWTTRRN